MLMCQLVEVSCLNGNQDRTLECQELHCPVIMPVKQMSVWRIWNEQQDKWVYYPFCSSEHFLNCVQPKAMPKG